METFGPGTNLPILFREALPLCLPKVIVSNRVSDPDDAIIKTVSTSELNLLLGYANVRHGPESSLGWTEYTSTLGCKCASEENHCIIKCDIIVNATIYLNSDHFDEMVGILNADNTQKTGPVARGTYGHERKHILAMHDLVQKLVINPILSDTRFSHLNGGNCELLRAEVENRLKNNLNST